MDGTRNSAKTYVIFVLILYKANLTIMKLWRQVPRSCIWIFDLNFIKVIQILTIHQMSRYLRKTAEVPVVNSCVLLNCVQILMASKDNKTWLP